MYVFLRTQKEVPILTEAFVSFLYVENIASIARGVSSVKSTRTRHDIRHGKSTECPVTSSDPGVTMNARISPPPNFHQALASNRWYEP